MDDKVHITPAQAKVAHLAASGLSNADIARVLQLSKKTVKNHINAIYHNGGVVNRNELIHAHQTGRLGTRQ